MDRMRTQIVAIPSLAELIDEFTAVLADPMGRLSGMGVANTEAQAAVLGNVRAAYLNQQQIPLPTDSSGARGAYAALEYAAQRLALFQVNLDGDLQPSDGDRVAAEQDKRGRLNPMQLFEVDAALNFGLYPFSAIEPALRGVLRDEVLALAPSREAITLVSVEESLDWETWTETFAR